MGPTYICLDFKTFVCQTCSGVHREFGHKIKGISLSEWTPFEVQDIESGGNEIAAQCWLARWNAEDSDCVLPDSGNPESVREFMRKKYVEKKWWKQPEALGQESLATEKSTTSGSADAKRMPAPTKMVTADCDLLGDLDAADSLALEKENTTTFDPNAAASAGSDAQTMATSAPSAGELMSAPPVAAAPAVSATDAQWTADFGESGSKAGNQRSNGPVGLMDLDFPVADVHTEAQEGGLSSVDLQTEAQPVAVGPEATTGDRLREALLSGSGNELNLLLKSAAEPEPETSVAERFEALQGNLQSLFSDSAGGNLPASPALAPTSPSSALPCSLPGVAGTVGMSTPGTSPDGQQLAGLSRQQLVQMQAMIVHALHEQEQSVQPQATSPEALLEELPDRLPEKEREFGDLLAMFNEKHPISGLS